MYNLYYSNKIDRGGRECLKNQFSVACSTRHPLCRQPAHGAETLATYLRQNLAPFFARFYTLCLETVTELLQLIENMRQ